MYTRFFVNLASLSDQQAQHLCSIDYHHEMAFIGVIGQDWEREQIIAGTAYYVDPETHLADIAIMVHPAWQRIGLGTAILRHTADYARKHGLRGFTADILCDNHAMLGTLDKMDLQTTKSAVQGAYEIVALFRST